MSSITAQSALVRSFSKEQITIRPRKACFLVNRKPQLRQTAQFTIRAQQEDFESQKPDPPAEISSDSSKEGPIQMNRRGMMRHMAGCACCSGAIAQHVDAAKADNTWYYIEPEGPVGPNAWGGACALGRAQSPVNLKPGLALDSPIDPSAVDFKYWPVKTTCLNTGHGTMQVNFPEPLYTMYGDRELKLLQFHFHTPSEHAINGKRSDMEVHLVHQDTATGGLVVFGTFLEGDAKLENPALRAALEHAPSPEQLGMENQVPEKIDPSFFVPPRGYRRYLTYDGSLTTPPCTEGVDWIVFGKSIKVTREQVVSFQKYITKTKQSTGNNSRPFQEVNGRSMERYGFNIANTMA